MRFIRPLSALLIASALAGCGTLLPMAGLRGASTLDAQGSKGPRGNDVEWTVFVYMAGDNSLSDFVTLNLNQMEAGLTSPRVKFVCLVDQAKQGDSRIVEITHDPAGMNDKVISPTVDDHGAVIPASHEVDTGSPDTLKRFLAWGAKTYKSHRSMLVIWNHGGSVYTDPDHLKSFAWDDTSNSHLNLIDFYRSVGAIDKQTFEVVGFDTCLLGHAETIYQLGTMTDFVVSSEKEEAGDGWNYEALARAMSANPDLTPRDVAGNAVKAYHDYYAKTQEAATLSAIDVKKMRQRAFPALDALSKNLLRDLGNANAFAGMRAVFDSAYQASATGDGEDDAIDLGLTMSLLTKCAALPADTRALANKAGQEAAAAVVGNATDNVPAGAYTGMKLYFDAQTFNATYTKEFGTATWAHFLQAYSAQRGPVAK